MPKKSSRPFDINPDHVKSEIVDHFSYTILSRSRDSADKAAIASAADPVKKAQLASHRITMHIENATTTLTFLKARGGVSRAGILERPQLQLAQLQKVKAELEQAIAFFDGITWPAE